MSATEDHRQMREYRDAAKALVRLEERQIDWWIAFVREQAARRAVEADIRTTRLVGIPEPLIQANLGGTAHQRAQFARLQADDPQ